MNQSFKTLKKETRVLGLDTCNSHAVTGAVVRGGLYLDGVIKFPRRVDSENIAHQIKATRYFPELRLIMVHDKYDSLEARTLHHTTHLPIITVRTESIRRPQTCKSQARRRSPEWSVLGMDPSMLAKIRKLTEVRGSLPEPVRIAHLLAKLHIFGRLEQDKG